MGADAMSNKYESTTKPTSSRDQDTLLGAILGREQVDITQLSPDFASAIEPAFTAEAQLAAVDPERAEMSRSELLAFQAGIFQQDIELRELQTRSELELYLHLITTNAFTASLGYSDLADKMSRALVKLAAGVEADKARIPGGTLLAFDYLEQGG